MSAEMEGLPESVHYALVRLAHQVNPAERFGQPQSLLCSQTDLRTVRAELIRLAARVRELEAENAELRDMRAVALADLQYHKQLLQAETSLVALRARIAEGITVTNFLGVVARHEVYGSPGDPAWHDVQLSIPHLAGKTVRLLVESTPAETRE